MSASTTTLQSQQSRRRRKSPIPEKLFRDVFLHACSFVSSISDLLNFREAMGKRGMVLPDSKVPSGQTGSCSESDNAPGEPSNTNTAEHSTDSTKKSFDEMDGFQEVAKNLVLSQWPSLKPLQVSMENKSRWLNIGRVLELRDESTTPVEWQRHVRYVRDGRAYSGFFKTDFCREHHDMLRDTVTFINVETREDPNCSPNYKTVMTAKFVHPVHGNWVSYEASGFYVNQDIEIYDFLFEFPIRPDSKQTVQCEFARGEGSGDTNAARRLWEYLTRATPPEFPPLQTDDLSYPIEEREKKRELGRFLWPLESAFPDIFEY